jgi:hypothetical protein
MIFTDFNSLFRTIFHAHVLVFSSLKNAAIIVDTCI